MLRVEGLGLWGQGLRLRVYCLGLMAKCLRVKV